MIHLVAVTACVSGVAHTYMAAERLEKLCHHEKWSVKIETQGALGAENVLSQADIAGADVALLITDIEINGIERFSEIRTVKSSIRLFLLEPQKVLDEVRYIMEKPVVHISMR
ncbi:PTS fructose-like transporter subunit IIB [Enterobacteriaceae bacterium 4M9]|nr:PTS fructose-like transporter subunit IIB [Enterobacteriaceae bacterium 4M9]